MQKSALSVKPRCPDGTSRVSRLYDGNGQCLKKVIGYFEKLYNIAHNYARIRQLVLKVMHEFSGFILVEIFIFIFSENKLCTQPNFCLPFKLSKLCVFY